MSEDPHYEIQQARDELKKLGAVTGVDVSLAQRYLAAAVAGQEQGARREWDSLFGFWRTLIRGGWRCPACGGEMTHGEASGVRCKTWNCVWVPGQRR